MKRELGIARCGLACVQKMKNAMAAIQITVLTMPTARTENALSKRDFQAAMHVKWIAKKDY